MGNLEEMIAARRLTVKSVTAAKAAADQELRRARRAMATKRMELLLIDLGVVAPVEVEAPGYNGSECAFTKFLVEGTQVQVDLPIMGDVFCVRIGGSGIPYNAESAQEVLDMLVTFFGGDTKAEDYW